MASESQAPSPLPKYVYKILPEAPPTPLPTPYPPSELDRKDGFVHLSSAEQVPVTADLYFASATSLWVLKLRLADLGAKGETRWEGPRGCAHLYGEFGAAEVEDAREFVRRAGDADADAETWDAALKRDGRAGWLV